MRNIVYAIILALGVLASCLLIAQTILEAAEQTPRQAHHPYEPFTIEVEVRDR